MNRAAKATFGFLLPLSFSFEFTEAGRLHVHGCTILPASIPDALAMFRRVLRIAGGKMAGLGSGRQCDVRLMHDSSGWHSYSGKDAARTRRLLGTDKITFISQDLRRATEDTYRAQSVIVTHRRVRTAKRVTDTRKPIETSQRAVVSQSAVPARRISLAIDQIRPIRNNSALTYYHKYMNYCLYTRVRMVNEAGVTTTGAPDLTKTVFISNDLIFKLADALANFDPFVINDKPDRDGYLHILGEIGDIWPESVRGEAEANEREAA